LAYERERDAYTRLSEHKVEQLDRFEVPQLLDWDDELLVLEMTIVQPPFLLDFGGAYLDGPPEFSDEVWEAWYEQKSEQFGRNWAKVQDLLAILKGYGVYLTDIHPRNINFLDEPEDPESRPR
jgi:hypothetical protein